MYWSKSSIVKSNVWIFQLFSIYFSISKRRDDVELRRNILGCFQIVQCIVAISSTNHIMYLLLKLSVWRLLYILYLVNCSLQPLVSLALLLTWYKMNQPERFVSSVQALMRLIAVLAFLARLLGFRCSLSSREETETDKVAMQVTKLLSIFQSFKTVLVLT